MDVQLVLSMFKDIKQQMNEIEETNKQKDSSYKLLQRQQEVKNQQVAELKQEVRKYQIKTEVLNGVVERLGALYVDMETKLENLELRQTKNSLVVNGIRNEGSALKCMERVRAFLSQDLQLEVNIVDCFKLGTGMQKHL